MAQFSGRRGVWNPTGSNRTGHALPVAVGGKKRLADAGTGNVVGKDAVHYPVDVLIGVPAVNPFLVVGGGTGNGKVIALVPVPFRVDAVQRKGHDSQHVGINGGFRPGGIDFGGKPHF